MKTKLIVTLLLTGMLWLTGSCTIDTAREIDTSEEGNVLQENEREYPIYADGYYGYSMADILVVDIEKDPEPGDIVLYDSAKNKSDCFAMGPTQQMVKITAVAGDNVTIDKYLLLANGYEIVAGKSTQNYLRDLKWGNIRYPTIGDTILTVPENEYLADKKVGSECIIGETTAWGDTPSYSRFTIKQTAIIGVIIRKSGHDDDLEEELKHIVY